MYKQETFNVCRGTFQRCFKFLCDSKNMFGILDEKKTITAYLLKEILRHLVYFLVGSILQN